MSTDIQSPPAHRPLPAGRLAAYGLLAIVASIVANLLIQALAKAIIDVSPEFLPLASAQPIIVFTGVFVLIAVLVFAWVDRRSANPARTYNWIALVALIVSVLPDLGLIINPDNNMFGGVTPAAVSVLIVMHIVAYAITVFVLTRLAYRH